MTTVQLQLGVVQQHHASVCEREVNVAKLLTLFIVLGVLVSVQLLVQLNIIVHHKASSSLGIRLAHKGAEIGTDDRDPLTGRQVLLLDQNDRKLSDVSF